MQHKTVSGRALRFFVLPFLFSTFLIGTATAGDHNVVINHKRLTNDQVHALQRQLNLRIMDGRYWYDRTCGAWGYEGGPTAGFILAGLDVGGRLRTNASNGNTGVYINGRQLHYLDVAYLQRMFGTVYRGRYWVDAYGNFGYEGGQALGNLVALSQQSGGSGGGGGGSTFYRGDYTDIGTGSSGGTTYVIGKDFSYISGY
ncbi:hypothetical protein SCOR_26030 [Sulfidibacter corallicola]|uniref:Uncharacterized protein n=1 Tax=Sulfidibacter corallicola TaxID=2818388 RepID=A0A8A4TRX6_SULCO|nr:hypothetical protein [Sulfidibacter corallicola]QTD52147.1 hypothetical protein J3U87_06700 [Sulfidibacter corallicola]